MLKRCRQPTFTYVADRGERCAVPDKSMQKPRELGAGRPVPSLSSTSLVFSSRLSQLSSTLLSSIMQSDRRYLDSVHACTIAEKTIAETRREVTRVTESRRCRVPLAGKHDSCTRVLRTRDANLAVVFD